VRTHHLAHSSKPRLLTMIVMAVLGLSKELSTPWLIVTQPMWWRGGNWKISTPEQRAT